MFAGGKHVCSKNFRHTHVSAYLLTFLTKLAAMKPPMFPRPRKATFLSAFELRALLLKVKSTYWLRIGLAAAAILDSLFKHVRQPIPALAQLDWLF